MNVLHFLLLRLHLYSSVQCYCKKYFFALFFISSTCFYISIYLSVYLFRIESRSDLLKILYNYWYIKAIQCYYTFTFDFLSRKTNIYKTYKYKESLRHPFYEYCNFLSKVTDGDNACKEIVSVNRADVRLLQPPWADELEDASQASPAPMPHMHMHHASVPVSWNGFLY